MADLLPLVVVETESGAEVRLRGADEGTAYATVYAALDSLLSEPEFAVKDGILRGEDGAPNGVWRWLDASAEEPAPMPDGSQVTRDLIMGCAARLNAGSPAPIDGGSETPAHGQLYDTRAPACGYAHTGVEVCDRGGRWHLWLRAELEPAVARKTDSGQLSFGSIGWQGEGLTARLLQHALTNIPAVEGLRPNNATRSSLGGARVFFRTMRLPMATTNKRGPAIDLLTKLALVLGVDINSELESETYESKILDAVYALKNAAGLEKVLDAAGGGAPPPATEGTQQATQEPAPAQPGRTAVRALEGFADQAAQDAWTSEVLGALRDVFGVADEAPAAVLDKLKASLAAFKGALGEGAPPQDAGAGDTSAMTAQPGEARTALSRTVSELGAEVTTLRAQLARRDTRDLIAKRASEAGVALPAVELEQLTDDALAVTGDARERCIQRGLRAAQRVPTGSVFGAGGQPATPKTLTEATEEFLEAAQRAAKAGAPRHHIVASAQRMAIARYPHLAA